MESFLNYIWTLLLIVLCFVGITICLALIVGLFKSMFVSKKPNFNTLVDGLCDEYIDLYTQKRDEGCSHEEANEYAYKVMQEKVEKKFK